MFSEKIVHLAGQRAVPAGTERAAGQHPAGHAQRLCDVRQLQPPEQIAPRRDRSVGEIASRTTLFPHVARRDATDEDDETLIDWFANAGIFARPSDFPPPFEYSGLPATALSGRHLPRYVPVHGFDHRAELAVDGRADVDDRRQDHAEPGRDHMDVPCRSGRVSPPKMRMIRRQGRRAVLRHPRTRQLRTALRERCMASRGVPARSGRRRSSRARCGSCGNAGAKISHRPPSSAHDPQAASDARFTPHNGRHP